MILNDYLLMARERQYAIGHFNFSTADVLRAIIEGSRDAGAPAVMVGTSEGEAEFAGMEEVAALVQVLRKELKFPIFLNADHFKSFDKCVQAIDAGYDSVLIDASKLPYEENIRVTKEVVDYARACGRPISVEGELGYLRGSSEVQKKVEISVDDYTKPEEAKDFVLRTGVNRLAVVFGNIHGIVTDQEERLDIEHFKKIVAALAPSPNGHLSEAERGSVVGNGRSGAGNAYLILHGASGLTEEDIAAAIKAGIVNVHFNTELRVAYQHALKKQFQDQPGETTPYKYLAIADRAVADLVAGKTRLFLGRV